MSPGDDTEEGFSQESHGHHSHGPSAAERYHNRRKAQTVQTRKQPTFDEREEQFLEETDTFDDMPNFETVQVSLESQRMDQNGFESTAYYSQSGNGVDNRILEQIEEFDRSFAFRESTTKSYSQFDFVLV